MTDLEGRTSWSWRPWLARVAAAVLVVLCLLPRVARAADAGSDAAADAGADAATVDPEITALRGAALAVQALVANTLDVGVIPQTLFDVPLGDDRAVDVEATRLTALLRDVDASTTATKPGAKRLELDGGASLDGGARELDPELWRARIALDRARLAFYLLSPARRTELLDAHAKRQEAAAPALTEAELRAKASEEERRHALQAAQDARSEAERLASAEYARLLDVEQSQAAFDEELTARRKALEANQEATLGWERRARDAREKGAITESVDLLYDELRKELKTARTELGQALDELSSGKTSVPSAGADQLADLPPVVDATAAREARARVDAEAARLSGEEAQLREERASDLLAEIDALNVERLALLPYLSADKRDAITGFGQVGAEQARSEVQQLALVIRYHRHATAKWLTSLRQPGQSLPQILWNNALVLATWPFAIGLFIWLRRRVPVLLTAGARRALRSDREERRPAPSLPSRVFAFALDVHRPLEWLGLALVMSWLLPATAKDLLEIQLITVIVQWVLGGALVVNVLNALAGEASGKASDADSARALRLRSLRLIGRVVVAFGLILVLSTRLVGQGTIYQWVLSTCWLASVPVILILVRWWRETVFTRAERARKKSPFENWVLTNRRGWKSFFAATAGAAYLFGRGVARAVQSWAGRFGVTRTVLAYLFRRELDKLSAERSELTTNPIPDAAFQGLGPETPSRVWISTDIDEPLDALVTRLRERQGGVIAVVGPRGMGKSTLLRRLQQTFPDTLMMSVPVDGAAAFRTQLIAELGLEPSASLDTAAGAAGACTRGRAILLDDVQRFIQPVMGGLADFDELLAAASHHCASTTWVLAFDEVVWLFLLRARAGRPLFDETIRLSPWREEQIIELLNARTGTVGITPTFERLLEKLPPNADEIDKQEALERRAADYYRLLWDYAAGNPGVALHMWGRSLGVDAAGTTHVRFFQAPDTADLETLPDPAIFVLRAVLQLSPARPDEIGAATMLGAADVADALRYALARGYVKRTDGRYVVTWAWFRPIVLFLERRHLLVAP